MAAMAPSWSTVLPIRQGVRAAVPGLLPRRRTRYGAGLLLALVSVAALAVATRPEATVLDLGPSLVAAVGAVAALVWLAREQGGAPPARGPRAAATAGP